MHPESGASTDDLMSSEWYVDPCYIAPRAASPERSWLDSVARDFSLSPEALDAALRVLAAGGSPGVAVAAAQPASAAQVVEVLLRMIPAGVLQRRF